MVYVIEFKDMVIARNENGLVGRVIDLVVGHPDTDARHDDVVGRRPHTFGNTVDVIVQHLMARRGQGLAITTADAQTAGAVVVDIATLNRVIGAPFDHGADESGVANGSARQGHAFAARHGKGVARAVFKGDAEKP